MMVSPKLQRQPESITANRASSLIEVPQLKALSVKVEAVRKPGKDPGDFVSRSFEAPVQSSSQLKRDEDLCATIKALHRPSTGCHPGNGMSSMSLFPVRFWQGASGLWGEIQSIVVVTIIEEPTTPRLLTTPFPLPIAGICGFASSCISTYIPGKQILLLHLSRWVLLMSPPMIVCHGWITPHRPLSRQISSFFATCGLHELRGAHTKRSWKASTRTRYSTGWGDCPLVAVVMFMYLTVYCNPCPRLNCMTRIAIECFMGGSR